jgi:methionyl-tRNA synthetase
MEQNIQQLLNNPWIVVLLALWVLPWKGIALWKAAQNLQKKWFIALLVLNTLGLLEIVYIFFFGKKKQS